ncbi:restriction endonuclease subunit S [Bifidobacterium pseudolongum]|uniref:restriction endonuclease subunit S n=1 Tax=Bifidobacterium pseudolongum TaxID=1694 RepID=UPI0013EBD94E|nr:restriction endonuclease subunit S [Bifidobacterium pseudolongum]
MSDYITDGKGRNTMVKKLQPKLRFRGFTDAWEQRKLGRICRITMGQSPKGQNYTNDFNQYILVQGNADIVDRWVQPRVWTKEVTKTAEAGDLILSVRAPVGVVAKTAFPIVLGRGVAGIKGGEYIYQFLFMLEANNYWKSLSSGSTFDSITKEQLIDLPVRQPASEQERNRIGKLLHILDSILAAEKRKLQLIEMKKRLLLQRILSGKMRFVGFCDSWIQLKLDDAICVCSGKDYKHLSKGNIPVYGTGGYMTSVSKALSNRDAIGIGRKGTIDKPYVLHAPFWTVDTLFYALPRNGYDLNFLFAVFQNINWKSKNESTGLPSLSKKNIENTCIITPSIDEQCRIGELFSLFDSILDETNQKIRLLEKKKKALLRDMFV